MKDNESVIVRGGTSATVVEEPDAGLSALEAANKTITIRSLRKEYTSNTMDSSGSRVAVDGVDMTMYEGQIFVLLGQNGAGKTTTISILTGLIPATSGSVTVYGHSVPDELESIRQNVSLGVCPQHDVLYPDLTVKEHLQLYAGLKGVAPNKVKECVEETVATVGLTEKVLLSVAHALCPEILIFPHVLLLFVPVFLASRWTLCLRR
jgi:ATP-binding cassette, subfamily A (ABC1), member 3